MKHALLSLHMDHSELDCMCAAIREGINDTNTCLQLFDSVAYLACVSFLPRPRLPTTAIELLIDQRRKTPSNFALGEG